MARERAPGVMVDVELLAEVERLRARTKESRSAVFNRAIKKLANAQLDDALRFALGLDD